MSIITLAKESLKTQKLTQDIAWSLGSFFILAVSGIVINIAITSLRDAAALGVFNLSYAVYIVASQFAVWGIHYSTLRHSAYYKADINERSKMLCVAIALTAFLGFLAGTILYFAKPLFVWFFESEATALAIQIAAFGLVFFPMNKALLAYLNGLREMKAFSILQGLRYFSVMLAVSALAATNLPVEWTSLGFLIAEVVTLISATSYIIVFKLAKFHFSTKWIKQHLSFGSRGLLGGMFAEINSRVDVILIGFFLDERATGIYSFAAMLVDGLYHVLAMVRINFNPLLVAMVKNQDSIQLKSLLKKTRKYITPVVAILSAGLILAYFLMQSYILVGKGLNEGYLPLIILLIGLNAISFLIPFDNLMIVSGHPGHQAIQQIATVFTNIIVAIILLPALGLIGAAIGTALSYVCNVTVLTYFSHKKLNWNLLRPGS